MNELNPDSSEPDEEPSDDLIEATETADQDASSATEPFAGAAETVEATETAEAAETDEAAEAAQTEATDPEADRVAADADPSAADATDSEESLAPIPGHHSTPESGEGLASPTDDATELIGAVESSSEQPDDAFSDAIDAGKEAPDTGAIPPPPPPPPPPPINGTSAPLERNLDRNIVGGVAAGMADYWGVSATWIRLGFAVLSVFGLLGVFVYGAAWILMPPNDGTESIADTWVRRLRAGDSWVGATLIALAALIVIGSLDFVSGELAFAVALFVLGFILYRGVPDRSPPPDPREGTQPTSSLSAETSATEVESQTPPPSAPPARSAPAPRPARAPREPKPRSNLNRLTVAILLITIGVMALFDMNGYRIEARQYLAVALAIIAAALLIGTWRGRARLMILPGLILLMPAFLLSFTSLTFDDTQVVTVHVQPQNADEIDALYRFSAGEVILDLSDVAELPGRDVRVELDAGSIVVILPGNGSARVVSEVGMGSISDVGYGEGINVTRRVVYRGQGDQLQLSLSADFGTIDVYRAMEN